MVTIKNYVTGEVVQQSIDLPIPDGWVIVYGVEVTAPRPFNWMLMLLIIFILYYTWR